MMMILVQALELQEEKARGGPVACLWSRPGGLLEALNLDRAWVTGPSWLAQFGLYPTLVSRGFGV